MPAGVLNLAGITVFEENNGYIDVPSGTIIRGLNLTDSVVNSAVFSSTTNILSLSTTEGNTISVDLSSLDGGGAGGGITSGDATALAIALG